MRSLRQIESDRKKNAIVDAIEAMTYSPEGQPLTGSFLDYAIPSADEVPVIHLNIRQTPSPTNPLGVKRIGE